jgi:Asp-tRNA(Asn)/Glu-tRNA(Gln) amidotransferase C subunit|tara:strand:+ start:1763 stop:2107 length:345 start_codon:yes stop_codon:yes gene_type:complete
MENGKFYAILIPVVLSLVILCVMLYLIYVAKGEVETFIKNNSGIIDTVNSLSNADEITGLVSSVNNISANMPTQEEIESLKSSLESIENTLDNINDVSSGGISDAIDNISVNIP